MFLKSLSILKGDGEVIRRIQFHSGLNLIVDDTPSTESKETGNNVGKTTVLKLIDFCLGGKPKEIYTDHENKRNEYRLVRNFLISNEVYISLVLKDDLEIESSREVLIERNFLKRKSKVQRINGVSMTDAEFEKELTELLFPGHYGSKPTFRQIIAHNIRYKDLSVNNTIKNLDRFTRDEEYETLYLFLLGCEFEHGDMKQNLRQKIKTEESFRKRLESEQTKSAYESALYLLQFEIEELEERKSNLNINPNFESDLDALNRTRYFINLASSEISRLELRRDLIIEAQDEALNRRSHIDVDQLRQLYKQATSLVDGIQKTFEDLYKFHNSMIESKVRFITKELPSLEAELLAEKTHLEGLLITEKELAEAVKKSDSFTYFEQIINELNEKYRLKGGYEKTLRQINSTELRLAELNKDLEGIDNDLFSDEFNECIKRQIGKFNKHFSAVSNYLYGEQYALKADQIENKIGRIYQFTAFNLNFSSGKKQGEISCFDIAYTLFADEENIPCMHFLLNDKKELMHGNQLTKLAEFVNDNRIQFVASILKDKLPKSLNKEDYIALRLSQSDKLFRIAEDNK